MTTLEHRLKSEKQMHDQAQATLTRSLDAALAQYNEERRMRIEAEKVCDALQECLYTEEPEVDAPEGYRMGVVDDVTRDALLSWVGFKGIQVAEAFVAMRDGAR